ncbi:NAD(P)H-hydrate dehydratase [[Clostridium] hylemonae]|uniref:NAD(P)H-hydrate dehydratase n=1 Tax=[Clostridium] hylemonae TaxID=89153 RepID=UPI001FCC1BBA|nr:NAD(P)H-hydrate dehydratase [[Clostridium] hylemonae]BDF04633.1 bifunctional NAD(P)H-hydrate repair enzyme Nnr [[Clostridium] hylemonae]
MKYLLNASQMKRADEYTTGRLRISSLELMERAAAGCVDHMEESGLDLTNVCVVCGTGNNGGDGFAAARMLTEKGHRATAVLCGEEEHCTKETKEQIKRLRQTGAAITTEFREDSYSVVIDALFGVGLNREIEGKRRELIDAMNRSGGFKLAVDIPSGVCADSGAVMGTAFRADATVTFQEMKLGLELYPGKEYAGKTVTVDIGIDTSEIKKEKDAAFTYECSEYKSLLPVRRADSNKGTYGRVLVIAGSRGMSGAAYLNARAAYAAGAGLVQIYTSEDNRVILQTQLPEAIIRTYDFYDEVELLKLLNWADVVSVGSGIGTSDKSRKILRTVMENVEVPCVIDADGLNLIADHKKYLDRLRHENFIFTPHMKEMSRMTGKDIPQLRARRIEILREFAEEYSVTCVLKDARTVTMPAGGRPYVNLSGNASMAKAGSGDVLAGIIAGLLAQGLDLTDAAVLGTYLHGRAGELASRDKGSYSVMASDLIEYTGRAMKEEEDR